MQDKGQKKTEHAYCTLQFKDRSRFEELRQKAPEYLSSMNRLVKGIESGTSTRFKSATAYKLVSSLAQFHPDYRGVEEVILDGDSLEAISTISFAKVKKGGSFNTHPAYIDSLTQPGGFVMNAKDTTDLELEVFVNHGWESFQIYTDILPEKIYRIYVKMVHREGSIWAGDTVVFDGDNIVAFFKGIAVSWNPRALL
jgi:noranthrone synthase